MKPVHHYVVIVFHIYVAYVIFILLGKRVFLMIGSYGTDADGTDAATAWQSRQA